MSKATRLAAHWSRGGVIIFNGGPGPLLRVSSAGGEPAKFTNAQPGAGHVFPSFLPDGKHVLFYGSGPSAGVFIAALGPVKE